ncbi:hypothetical protein ATOBIA_N07630 [Atopobiaceae bacterium P1]|nr:hypothetical protein ATOBIA_N07630 [Atopobiaceae bacterium P1]
MANVSSSNGLEKRPKLRFPGFDEPWCSHKFSAVFSFLQNNTLSRAELDATGDVLDIHYGDVLIKYGSILDATDNTIPHIISGHESTNYDYLQDGDIIVADTAEDKTVGKTIELLNISGRKIEAGLHTVPCRPLFPFASMYLGYYMNTPHYHKQLIPLMQGIKVLSISKGNISKTEISSPQTIAEQEKISRFLYLLDQRAAAQSKIIDALKKYKRGLHKLVFIKKRKPSWEKLALHDIASFCGGGTPSKDVSSYWEGEIGWISSSDIQEEWIDDISVTRRITKTAIDNSATKLCPEGTIAIVSRVGVGKVAIMPESLCTSQDFTNITSITGNTHYMAYQIAFRMKLEAMKTQGTSIKGVTGDTIKAMVLDIPPLEEQKKIADMLTAFDSYIKRAVCELDLFLAMKKALLQQLFI